MTQLENDGFEQEPSRYVVGIDLGTTNCAVSYIDTQQAGSQIVKFPVPQWVDFGVFEARDLLPSFLYQPLATEAESLQSTGSDSENIVGGLARDRGLVQPGRQVQSAKSWLCHDGVDRRGKILPWQSDEDVDKVSPVDASARYLEQIRLGWDKAFPGYPLAEQDIVVTLPASFDQVARQLTVEAAAQAGLKRILPIEEPQAAFYAWLARHREDWDSQVQAGQSVLVCDIGGGTTDFTLIRVRESSHAPAPETQNINESTPSHLALHRVAVGQHLILGGDNIDLALAKLAEHKLTGGQQLPPRSWEALRQASRVAKETLLGDKAPKSYTVHLPGSGSRLIGSGQQVEIASSDVDTCIMQGFFPDCGLNDRPEKQQVGFQEFGLPFATDAAITKHLAAFLWDHRQDGRSDQELTQLDATRQARPDWILFNGGVMTSTQIRQRIVQAVGQWFSAEGDSNWLPGVLDGERMDRAVASGAAYFGLVRRGEGVKIEAKLASAFYMQTTTEPPQAVCIVPGSASPGDTFRLDELTMDLTIGQPVQFPISYSSTRLADRVGKQVELRGEEFTSLPPVRTIIELSGMRKQETIPVVVETQLSQIGTLQTYCQSTISDHRWKLEFDVRGSTQTDHQELDDSANAAGVLDERVTQAACQTIRSVFGDAPSLKPAKLMNSLAGAVELRRDAWPPSLLRAMWAELIGLSAGRQHSPAHEARWLNLLGYCLRPGYGLVADDWRVAQTWRSVHGKLKHPAISSRNEAMILWRRIAGGFTPGQQLTVYQQVAGPLRATLDPVRRSKGGGGTSPTELVELLRLVGSLELLPTHEKMQLGDWLLELLCAKKWAVSHPAILWTLGRLGSRVPAYGPLNSVLPSHKVAGWLKSLLARPMDDSAYPLALMLCARKVDDRYRDVPAALREEVAALLTASAAPAHYAALVSEGGQLEGEDANQMLGEALPLGLRLRA